MNTFPKASPLNVCILLCIPVCDFRRSAQEGNSLSAQRGSQPQEKRSRGVAAQHDSLIRDSTLLTGRRGSQSHSRRTADPLHVLSGISAFFPPAPESASPNACLRIFHEITRGTCRKFSCSSLSCRTDFPVTRMHQREISRKGFLSEKRRK